MKAPNLHFVGKFFFPSLGLAFISLAVGYWISRTKHSQRSDDKNIPSPSENSHKSSENGIKTAKAKKHKCQCGSKTTSKFENPPSQIKIMYGTLMGKSKVTKCSGKIY